MIRWFQGRRFRPGIVPTLATVALLVLLVGLGRWQLERAEEKTALFASFDRNSQSDVAADNLSDEEAAEHRYMKIRVQGRFDSDRQFLLESMPGANGRPGYHVLTPLLRDGEESAVIVNRGWIPFGGDRSRLPEIGVDTSSRTVNGRVGRLPRPGLETEAVTDRQAGWPKPVLFPRMDELEALLGAALADYVILLNPEEPAGYARTWRPKLMTPQQHLGYAVQWFALAAALAIIYLAVNMKLTGKKDD